MPSCVKARPISSECWLGMKQPPSGVLLSFSAGMTVADGLAHLWICMAASAADMGKEAKAVIKAVRDLSHVYKFARHATGPLVAP